MSDETDTTGEVARVLELGHAWYEATVAYHRAVEEAFRPLLEMGRARAAQEAQIAAPVPAEQPHIASVGSGSGEGVGGAVSAADAALIEGANQAMIRLGLRPLTLDEIAERFGKRETNENEGA